MTAPDEIRELRDLVRMFHREGTLPTVASVARFFDGRARGYLSAMADLGQIQIDPDGNITECL